MIVKACCVTGRRNIPPEKIESVRADLKAEILESIEDGYTTFISGMAAGVDLMFVELLVEFQKEHRGIVIEAAIPYRGRIRSPDLTFQSCFDACNRVFVTQEEYSKECYMKQNRAMVDLSEKVIGVWDGVNSGGTFATLQYAKRMSRSIKIINI